MPLPRSSQSQIASVEPAQRDNRKLQMGDRRRAFTLIEMMTTVAVLVIVLGLMVSLARDVRTRSAERLTKDLLARLDTLVEQYRRPLRTLPEDQRRIYPSVHPLVTAEGPNEEPR